MDFTVSADFLDDVNDAFDSNSLCDSNRGEGVVDETSHYAMPSNTVSLNSLQSVVSSDLHMSSASAVVNSSVPEFLYQLTKMLAQDNREVIEWSNGKFTIFASVFDTCMLGSQNANEARLAQCFLQRGTCWHPAERTSLTELVGFDLIYAGRIEVHNPSKLEKDVLNKYFRHSKFSSFQRQLNYFGFRKLAGKGKMAPCSYVNDAAGDDIASLIHIKVKGSNEKNIAGMIFCVSIAYTIHFLGQRKGAVINPRDGSLSNKKKKETATKQPDGATMPQRHGVVFNKPNVAASAKPQVGRPKVTPGAQAAIANTGASFTQQALARRAVGRGVRHGFASSSATTSSNLTTRSASSSIKTSLGAGAAVKFFEPSKTDNLSQLAINYRNVLNEERSSGSQGQDETDPTPLSEMRGQNNLDFFDGFLSRNSSLVDLAMIAPVDDDEPGLSDLVNDGFGFVDFPNPEVHPANSGEKSCDKIL